MKTGHLFAGSGGGLLADKILGHTPIFAVEWERSCCDDLRAGADAGWYPGLRVHECDARLFDPSEYAGRVDALHAGFPCTDISLAGNGEGIDGDQSGLWSEVARVAGILRPQELFVENSPAIAGRGLDRVLSDLAALGYDAKWLCLSADRVGAPHERDRWWCLATLEACHAQSVRRRTGGKGRFASANERAYIENEQIPDAESQGSKANGVRFGTAEEIPGDNCDSWWSLEPNLDRMVYGLADGPNRIKALGNGQVPLQAAVAYRLLKS